MKKQLSVVLLTAVLTTSTNARVCKDGYDSFEHLGSCWGDIVDAGIGAVVDLPEDTKNWTEKQRNRARTKLEDLKSDICDNKPIVKEVEVIKEVVKEVPVEVIKEIVVEKIVEVPVEKVVYIMPKQRRCTTVKKSDRFRNVEEITTCTEWKQVEK